MANRKASQRNIRKITKLGKKSLAITLPVEMMKRLKWKQRQRLVVKVKGTKLIISDWKPKVKRKA